MPVAPRAAACSGPVTRTGVSRGNSAEASGAVPTSPMTDDLTVRIGLAPLETSMVSTPWRNWMGMMLSFLFRQ